MDAPRLCVLSSSSSGNCSVLVSGEGESARVTLIDLGLSPRRTRALLASLGLGPARIHGVVLTHLDDDHFDPSWAGALPEDAVVCVHKRHLPRAQRVGLAFRAIQRFEHRFDLPGGWECSARLGPHDDLGSAVLRFEHAPSGATLGFATDVGRMDEELTSHLAGVGVLAIESNYCPRMQRASGRPEFLVRRVMGGSGHLSNQQSARAADEIGSPVRVLLHLSRQCNTPALARGEHEGSAGRVIVASDTTPTSWIELPARAGHRPRGTGPLVAGQATLWGPA